MDGIISIVLGEHLAGIRDVSISGAITSHLRWSPNKFCPPGFIIDESGYSDPETSSLVPNVDSTEGSENTTSKVSKESEQQYRYSLLHSSFLCFIHC